MKAATDDVVEAIGRIAGERLPGRPEAQGNTSVIERALTTTGTESIVALVGAPPFGREVGFDVLDAIVEGCGSSRGPDRLRREGVPSAGSEGDMTATGLTWEFDGTSRIPFEVYTSDELHRTELERFFYRRHWCYVGLEVEIPNPGDFVRTVVGERSVSWSATRQATSTWSRTSAPIGACGSAGQRHGNTTGFVCPYHQWRYNLQGDLRGVPFRAGVKDGDQVEGGMPDGLRPRRPRPRPSSRSPAEAGSCSPRSTTTSSRSRSSSDRRSLRYFDRLFNGRELTLLGYNRQRIPGNWKLMLENIKDPYHPGLLHTWFVTFGLWRADNTSQLRMDDQFRHAAMISTRGNAGKTGEATDPGVQLQADMVLHDPSQIDVVPESWWGGPSVVMPRCSRASSSSSR